VCGGDDHLFNCPLSNGFSFPFDCPKKDVKADPSPEYLVAVQTFMEPESCVEDAAFL
jgi:hypothetical protein